MVWVGVLLVVRGMLVLRLGIDSDEPQHLHIIHGWLNGELPYRDRFDNHTPLFHWIMTPLVGLVGESERIVEWARLAMVPIWATALGLFFGVARRLYDRAVAWWSLALMLALADWSLKTLEFRPDGLWMVWWLGAVWVLVRWAAVPGWRVFLAVGLLLGLALVTSVKTIVLLAALALGWVGAWVLSREFRRRYRWERIGECVVAGALGLGIAPLVLWNWAVGKGIEETMVFCLFEVNQTTVEPWRVIGALMAGVAVIAGAGWLARRGDERDGIRVTVFLAAALYVVLIIAVSPSLKKQTFMVAYPLLVMSVWGGVTTVRGNFWTDGRRTAVGSVLCAGLAAHLFFESAIWREGMRNHRELLGDVLGLTRFDDTVMDLKGETVFRRRAVYPAYVLATGRAMEAGRLEVPGAEELESTRTAVAVASTAGFPSEMRKYLRDNFVPVGRGHLRVAGAILKPSWEAGRWTVRKELRIRGEYVVVRDGEVIARRVVEAPGEVVFDFGESRERAALIWRRAWEAGYLPDGFCVESANRER